MSPCLCIYYLSIHLSPHLLLREKEIDIARKYQIRENYMGELQTYEAIESKTKMKTRGPFIFIKS